MRLRADLGKLRAARPTTADEPGAIGSGDEGEGSETEPAEDEDAVSLLDLLFDEGLLPSYAFPTGLCSFVIQEWDNRQIQIKERPQLGKTQALSEYAPGRLLVVNKQTYRVGGLFFDGAPTATPAAALLASPLRRYVGCKQCTFVRIEEGGSERLTTDGTPCPVCGEALAVREFLHSTCLRARAWSAGGRRRS